jgi:hypothetical protein
MNRLSIKDIYRDESYYSGAQTEPVSLSETKAHLNIEDTFTTDDALISGLISAARNQIENFCNISILSKLITCTLAYQSNAGPYKKNFDRLFLGQGPYDNQWFQLPYGPIRGLLTVTAVDQTTIINMVLNQDYFLTGTQFLSIQFQSMYPNYILIYQAGWPSIPSGLKLAILNEVAFRYENRGDNTNRYASQNVGLCEAAEYLASPFKRLQL